MLGIVGLNKKTSIAVLAIALSLGQAAANDISNGSYSTTDGNNTATPPNGWPASGMFPNQVTPSARSNMGATARFWERINAPLTTTGSAPGYIVTPSNILYPTAYTQGEILCAKASFTSIGGDTLNYNGLTPKAIYKSSSTGIIPIVAGDIQLGAVFCAAYDAVLNSSAGGFQLLEGLTQNLNTGPTGPAGGDLTGTYPNPTLAATAVTPGTYTNSTITVDAKGRLTAASNGTSPTPTGPVILASGNVSTGTQIALTSDVTTFTSYSRIDIELQNVTATASISADLAIVLGNTVGGGFFTTNYAYKSLTAGSGVSAQPEIDLGAHVTSLANSKAWTLCSFYNLNTANAARVQCSSFDSIGSANPPDNYIVTGVNTATNIGAVRFQFVPSAGTVITGGTYRIVGWP